jgi:hypothetical protein
VNFSLVQVQAAIDKNKWVGKKPIGPIGTVVQVKPEAKEWLRAIESCLTNK